MADERTHRLTLTIDVDPTLDVNRNVVGTLTMTVTGSGDGLDLAFLELINTLTDDMHRALMDAIEPSGRDL